MISSRLNSAIEFAYSSHQYQLDKSGKPYFIHPLRVMMDVQEYGEDAMIVAILHDVVEDCNVPLSTIEARWGKEISDAVDSVSRRVEPVKETYVSFVERSSLNKIGRIVKLADLNDNMRPERMDVMGEAGKGLKYRYERAKKFLMEGNICQKEF